jgi:hypothetical protein
MKLNHMNQFAFTSQPLISMCALQTVCVLTQHTARFSLKSRLVDVLSVFSEQPVIIVTETIGIFLV